MRKHLYLSVTRFGKIWRNFATLAKFQQSLGHFSYFFGLVFANFCTYFGNFYATGQIFYYGNGKRVKNNISIWSHWCWCEEMINRLTSSTVVCPDLSMPSGSTLSTLPWSVASTTSKYLTTFSTCGPSIRDRHYKYIFCHFSAVGK